MEQHFSPQARIPYYSIPGRQKKENSLGMNSEAIEFREREVQYAGNIP